MNKKKEKVEQSISKVAFARTKATFANKSQLLVVLFLICLISIVLGCVFVESLIFSIPFLVIPAFFAFLSVNSLFEPDFGAEKTAFFVMFRNYFSVHFNGGFKLLLALLKAFVTMLIVSTLIMLVGTIILSSNYPEFLEGIKNALPVTDELEVSTDELFKFLDSNVGFNKLTDIAYYASFGAGSMMFIHSTMVHSVKFYFNLLGSRPIFAHDLNTIHKETFKKIKRPFFKDYYKAIWFIPLLMIVGYSLGVYLSVRYITPSIDPVVIGLFGMFIFTLFLIPYFFDVTLTLFKKYQSDYFQCFIDLSIETLKEMKKTNGIDPKQEKEIMNFLASQKKISEDSNKEDKNKKSHD